MASYKWNDAEYVLLHVDINATDNPIDIIKVSMSSTRHCLGVEGFGWRLLQHLPDEGMDGGGKLVAFVFDHCQKHPEFMGVIETSYGVDT